MTSRAQAVLSLTSGRVTQPSSECYDRLATEIELIQTKLGRLSKRQSIINELCGHEDMRDCFKDDPEVERMYKFWSEERANLATALQNKVKAFKESASRCLGQLQVVIGQLCTDEQKPECGRAFECVGTIISKMLDPEAMEAKLGGDWLQHGKDKDMIGRGGCYSEAGEEPGGEARQQDRREQDLEDDEDEQYIETERQERRNYNVEDEQDVSISGVQQREEFSVEGNDWARGNGMVYDTGFDEDNGWKETGDVINADESESDEDVDNRPLELRRSTRKSDRLNG